MFSTFRSGVFLGRTQRAAAVGPAAVAELRPTVPERDVEPHVHSDAHFVLVLAGAYVSTARGMPPVSSGSVLVYNPPGTAHRDRFRGLQGRFFTVSLPPDAVRGLPPTAVRGGGVARHRAYALREALWQDDDVAPLQAEVCLAELVESLRGRREPAEREGPPWLSLARERLRDGAADAPRLAELAGLCGVHPVVFARTFRRWMGRSPGEYLRECRLDRALDLLRDRRLGLAEVAIRAGYVDQSHLCRHVRAAVGCTPGALRAREVQRVQEAGAHAE